MLQLNWVCAGSEDSLFQCPYASWSNYQFTANNDHTNDVGVRCIKGSSGSVFNWNYL